MKLVVCETNAAVALHLREVTEDHPLNYGGHPWRKVKTLCGHDAAWDTKIPVGDATCNGCKSKVTR